MFITSDKLYNPFLFFKEIKPSLANILKALSWLVGSLGMATLAPLGICDFFVYFVE